MAYFSLVSISDDGTLKCCVALKLWKTSKLLTSILIASSFMFLLTLSYQSLHNDIVVT